jgi:hypothetical protein
LFSRSASTSTWRSVCEPDGGRHGGQAGGAGRPPAPLVRDRPEARRSRVHRLRIPGIDRQPCGGIHVRDLAEIGPVIVWRFYSEGKREGNRNPRVEIGFG